jgi:tRNA G18 (ribose-2'-O)-methylase SpoU
VNAVRERRKGEVVVDGRRLVSDLVRWKVPIEELYLVPEISDEFEAMGWRDTAEAVFEIEASVLDDIAPTKSPQGVLAIAREPQEREWTAGTGVTLWLDRIQDPGNIGAIIRSAAGLGAAAVLLSPGCADPFASSAVRGSAGASFRVPLRRHTEAGEAIEAVRQAGGEAWATDSRGQKIEDWRPSEPCLLLLIRRWWLSPTERSPSPCPAASKASTSPSPPASSWNIFAADGKGRRPDRWSGWGVSPRYRARINKKMSPGGAADPGRIESRGH